MKRRKFLKLSASAAIGMPAIIPSSALGLNGRTPPSGRIVMAGIGLGSRGRKVLRESFLIQPDVQFVAIADVQADQREIIRRIVNLAYANEDCAVYRDMNEVLARDDVDAVLIATGNRWHGLASMLAARAGKDVYCEKPNSMSVMESMDLVKHIGGSGQVFQAGMQRRNIENFVFAAGLAQSGKLGKLTSLHAGILPIRPNAEPLPAEPEPDPDVCDWDRWLGPAPHRAYNRGYVLNGWKNYYDLIGGAGLPEWGSHTLDLCHWAGGLDASLPVHCEPGVDSVSCTYATGVKLIMRRAGFGGEGDWRVKGSCPVRFEGNAGWVEADDFGQVAASDPSLLEGMPENLPGGTTPTRHVREFLDAVKTRGQTSGNVRVAANTHAACHVAAISLMLNRPVTFNQASMSFGDDDAANRLRDWPYREPWNTILGG